MTSSNAVRDVRDKVVVTVLGADKVGIVAGITSVLASCNANIEDLASTKMGDIFVMIMLVDITEATVDILELRKRLSEKAEDLGVQVIVQHYDIFKAMHRV